MDDFSITKSASDNSLAKSDVAVAQVERWEVNGRDVRRELWRVRRRGGVWDAFFFVCVCVGGCLGVFF